MNSSSQTDVSKLFQSQQRFFASGATLGRAFRVEALKALRASIVKHEQAIYRALRTDLRKCEEESWVTEYSFLLNEIDHALGHLKDWMRASAWGSPIAMQPARSEVHPQPMGTTLVLGAWNYPIQLTLGPVIPALAAGNVVVVKPSELAPASSEVCRLIIEDAFSVDHVACVEGGIDVSTNLLEQPFKHMFYTGSTRVGRIIAMAAAKHLSRATLEMGGKSPVIVTAKANLELAARRIAWGKCVNAGQTCVAPDYALVEREVYDAFLDKLSARLSAFYPDGAQASPDFARIINDGHFERLSKLMESGRVRHGGETDASERFIAPTILEDVSLDSPIMQEEIFGPLLPVIPVDNLDHAIRVIERNPDPLALYIFSKDSREQNEVIARVSFGGGAINDCMVHLGDPDLPFGGIGASGLGAYHGKPGFDRFSHFKSVVRSKANLLTDPPLRYPPYGGRSFKLLKVLV